MKLRHIQFFGEYCEEQIEVFKALEIYIKQHCIFKDNIISICKGLEYEKTFDVWLTYSL